MADDHTLFRRGIADVLAGQKNLQLVGEACDGLQAIKKARELKPDVILMDLMMPNCTGLEATQALQAEMPGINILVLTVSDKEEDLFAAMKFGARGYILKSTEPDDLVRAISDIAQGGVILSPMMASKLLAEFKEPTPKTGKDTPGAEETGLSPREDEVLHLLAEGAPNKQIADSLSISENTVKTHLRNIMEKLHLANRSQAAAYAVKKGLLAGSAPRTRQRLVADHL